MSVHCGATWAQIEKHIWAYLFKEFSYPHNFWPDDSQWGSKNPNKPN